MAPKLIATDIRELLPMRRAPGHHVSTIINRIAVLNGRFDPKQPGDRPPQFQLEAGSSFEEAIATGLAKRYALDNPGRYVHGLELELDGVTGNLDLLDVVDCAVEEVKLTKSSIKHIAGNGIESDYFWHYWAQLKSYAHMLGVDTGRLHVGFVNGNYRYDETDPLAGWQYRVWEDRWTAREMQNHWRTVLGHRK